MGNCGCNRRQNTDLVEFHINRTMSTNIISQKISINDFQILKTIGKGSFAQVFLARKKNSSRQLYAMKSYRRNIMVTRQTFSQIQTQRQILIKTNSPFIVKLYYAFQSKYGFHFVMEYMPAGPLFNYIKREKHPESTVRFYASQIFLGLEYLHLNSIIYRDLKAENILLDSKGHAKLADFGLSKIQSNQMGRTYTVCGTLEYMAPEIYGGVEGYTRAADYWSLGVLIYEMLVGVVPNFSYNKKEMLEKNMIKPFTPLEMLSDQANDLLGQLLEVDVSFMQPNKRLSNPILIRNHQFFKDIDWMAMMLKTVEPPIRPAKKQIQDLEKYEGADIVQETDEGLMWSNFTYCEVPCLV